MISHIIKLSQDLDPNADSFQNDCLLKLQSLKLDLPLNEFNREVAKWIGENKLPPQLNVYNNFGQPPLTLYNDNNFVIDLYFWLHSDTSIHTHSFKGAFRVLYGKSKQEIFQLNETKKYFHDVKFNEFSITENKILMSGDCQEISSGNSFCHRVSHLLSPTITLCIRTNNDKEIPQWHQFENGLSILKVELEEEIYKSIFFFEYLLSQNHKSANIFLKEIIQKHPRSVIMNLFEEVLAGSLGLSEKSMEIFHDFVINQYKKEEWFDWYLKACE